MIDDAERMAKRVAELIEYADDRIMLAKENKRKAEAYRRDLYRALHDEEGVSFGQLSEATGLSRARCSQLVMRAREEVDQWQSL